MSVPRVVCYKVQIAKTVPQLSLKEAEADQGRGAGRNELGRRGAIGWRDSELEDTAGFCDGARELLEFRWRARRALAMLAGLGK
jgi:hypothetical protein